jgi:hydroxymethylglutaryl-CoA synthase
MRVGIERLAVHVPQYVLPMERFAAARRVPVQKLLAGLGVLEMAVTPPWEDAVTLAANAGSRLLRGVDVDPDEIGMLLVATETGVDHSKPVAVFVHDLLRIGSRCRVYELKHACYSGTAAVMTAADWVRAGGARRRRALVIATDIARYAPGSPGEPTQGAGAVAMLIGPDPATLELDEDSGTYAAQVNDFWRPFGHREAIVDGPYSLACYLDALSGAFAAYRALPQSRLEAATLLDEAGALLFHAPFPRMAGKAHRRLVELALHAGNGSGGAHDAEVEARVAESYPRLVDPGLGAVARIGNAYTASLYLCLATLLEQAGGVLAGRPLALFSYGSGCCAELFTGVVPAAGEHPSTGLAELLSARTVVDFDYYEQCLHDPGLGGTPAPDATAEFVFRGITGERRQYERLGCATARARHTEPAAAVNARLPVG